VRPPAKLDSRAVDAIIAIVACVAGLTEVALASNLPGPRALDLLFVPAYVLPLAWRRRHALEAGLLILAVICLEALLLGSVTNLVAPLLSLLVVGYGFGRYEEGRRALLGVVCAVVAVVIVAGTAAHRTEGDYLFPGLILIVAWLSGRAVRSRTRLTEELHEAAVRAGEEHEHEAERAVAEERRRVARELHDIVAHSISVMVIQAGGARRILAQDPARATEAAGLIEQTGREALGEMRRLLGMLRSGESGPQLGPQPGLAELAALVERARGAGLPVSLAIQGDRRDIPQGVDLAAYRVVQEALTNCLRHAGAAATEVLVRYADRELELEIADRGPGPAVTRRGDGDSGAGHGLVGMNERVLLYGGELQTGRRAGGGFRVHARIPVGGDEVPA
jgi:signal transduction histidine kinase